MNKKEYIERHGVAAYEKKLQRDREYYQMHLEEQREHARLRYRTHPGERERHRLYSAHSDKVKANSREASHKGGKYYERQRKYFSTGLPHERKLVRLIHGQRYRPYKKIIAPETQIHHEWVSGTADYTGVALVEKDQHAHGFIDVIQILEGGITLLTEEEVRNGGIAI